MSREEVLKACPFCGGEATTQENLVVIKGRSNGAKNYEVGCDNVGCFVLPSCTALDMGSAMDGWDQRAALAEPGGGEELSMSQSRLMSFIEAKSNAILGLVISWLFTYYGLPLFGIQPSAIQATGITACYFFLSFTRSYVLRRLFNRRNPMTTDDTPTCKQNAENLTHEDVNVKKTAKSLHTT